ncbi:LysR family transcriptional regulator [Maritalea sp. S77]|uniref:LysR family transcriptional regulator n=1 Tax=Maritalea sp. S77 TaxID=3415125 RepID=UPI003C7CFADE
MKFGWDEIRLFTAVAEAGGLTGASTNTGMSPATLGRHIASLENNLGSSLFLRSPRGYQLTELGEDLLAHAQNVSNSMSALQHWSDQLNVKPTVRISAGPWTSSFLSQHMAELWQGETDLMIELVTGLERVDIGHRHAEIGIRNARPHEQWLAGRKLGEVAYALYARADGDIDHKPCYIGVTDTLSGARSAQWLNQNHSENIVLRASDSMSVREMAASGVGQAVLPCFIGDQDSRLQRSSPPIDALRTEQWLVMHHEERHRPVIRRVADRLAHLLQNHQSLFEATKKADPNSPPNSL